MDREKIAAQLLLVARELIGVSSQLKILRSLSDFADERLDIKEVKSGVFKAWHQRDGIPLELSIRGRPWKDEFSFFELYSHIEGRMPTQRMKKFQELHGES